MSNTNKSEQSHYLIKGLKNSAEGIKQKGNAPPVNLLNSVRGNVFVPDSVKLFFCFVFFDEPSLKLVSSCWNRRLAPAHFQEWTRRELEITGCKLKLRRTGGRRGVKTPSNQATKQQNVWLQLQTILSATTSVFRMEFNFKLVGSRRHAAIHRLLRLEASEGGGKQEWSAQFV